MADEEIFRKRPLTSATVLLRAVKYIIIFEGLIVLTTLVLVGADIQAKTSQKPENSVIFNVFNALLLSPVLETFLFYFLYLACRGAKLSEVYLDALFIACTAALAWLSHGHNVGALFPTSMFVVSAVFVVRTVRHYGGDPQDAFFGAFVIHLIYNIPYAARQVLLA